MNRTILLDVPEFESPLPTKQPFILATSLDDIGLIDIGQIVVECRAVRLEGEDVHDPAARTAADGFANIPRPAFAPFGRNLATFILLITHGRPISDEMRSEYIASSHTPPSAD